MDQRHKVKCKYNNRKPIGNILYIDSSNICPICHRLWDIHSYNFRDLDFDL